jgi:hypothetical protein
MARRYCEKSAQNLVQLSFSAKITTCITFFRENRVHNFQSPNGENSPNLVAQLLFVKSEVVMNGKYFFNKRTASFQRFDFVTKSWASAEILISPSKSFCEKNLLTHIST